MVRDKSRKGLVFAPKSCFPWLLPRLHLLGRLGLMSNQQQFYLCLLIFFSSLMLQIFSITSLSCFLVQKKIRCSMYLKFFSLWKYSFSTDNLFPYYAVKFSGLFLPAVVRPILDSYQASKQPPQTALSDVSVVFATSLQKLFAFQAVILSSILSSYWQYQLYFTYAWWFHAFKVQDPK